MDNLNASGENPLEMENTNFITLLRDSQKFKETFYQVMKIGSQCLKSQQNDKALKAFNKCMDMLDLGKNILNDISKYCKLCIYGNLACAYQGTWKMQKCNKFCQKAEQQLIKLIETAQSKQINLNLTKCLIRIRFQHCAILSQLNQHQKALQMCKETLVCLEKYIRNILEYAQSLENKQIQSKSSQTVQFSKQVSTFAQQILKNLIKNLTDPLNLSEYRSSFYYWERNPQNNQDQVKKRFVSNKSTDECKRSILGVNKMSHWIDQFNIGTIMHMSELTIKDFQNVLPIEQYIFKDKLFETVIYCSVAHFTIATEMRFIESNRQRQNKPKEQPAPAPEENKKQKIIQSQQILKKYGEKQKSEMFKLSQLYHLRAIHIIAQNIKSTVPYISHLIKSYDKHYIFKKQLEPVVAIQQQSIISVRDQLKSFQGNKQQHMQNLNQFQEENNYYVGEQQSLNFKKNSRMILKFEDENERQQQQLRYKQMQKQQKEKEESQQQDQHQIVQPLHSYIPIKIKSNYKSKSRNKSEGRIDKTPRKKMISNYQKVEQKKQKVKNKQKQKLKFVKPKQGKELKKKKSKQIESQVQINHQSCTQIKVLVFKKKK